MPKPILKENDLIVILKENIRLLSEIDKSIKISLKNNDDKIFFRCDKEQISRAFFNLLKNSVESIQQKFEKNVVFNKEILIEITNNNDHIKVVLIDNGIGFTKITKNIKDILNPYFTTKKNGTGLGLSIVNKIINDHDGILSFESIKDGAKIEIKLKVNGDRNFNS